MDNEQIDISHLLAVPVKITWIRGKKRQKTVQRKIFRLLKRQKFFVLNTGDEEFFVDSGAWVWEKGDNGKYNKIIRCDIYNIYTIICNVVRWIFTVQINYLHN